MSRKLATFGDHTQFCEIEGWKPSLTARGKANGDHRRFTLSFEDALLMTRISHGDRSTQYSKGLWATIVKKQLEVTDDEFWLCVEKRIKPARSAEPAQVSAPKLPPNILYQLITKLRITNERAATIALEDAMALLNPVWSSPAT